ncbi:Uncharacterised protein [Raoultella terrigena]|uniref:DUF6602 domain-containing protein n=1 Tax=Raoultella terrigena TaxID=577 RepID=UPI001161F7B6|nr:DUF6602 domain-containing protein [Raoultella terrigena]VUC81189.1 Uncharacterised protein [Raoultella terrigena]
MTQPHELFSFFKSISGQLSSEYERISARAKEDPGTAGDEGEESWKQLLEHWLPPQYKVVTKGRLLSANGEASPQIDVIILKPFYPPFLVNKKYYLIDGVAAAFECKTTLRPRDLEKSFKTAAIISRLCKKKVGNPCIELLPPVPYGILAHSHSWLGEEETVVNLITKKVKELGLKYALHPRELLETICIADLAGWTTGHSICMCYPINEDQIPDREARKAIFSLLKKEHAGFLSAELYQENGLDVLYVHRPYSQYFTQYIKKPTDIIHTETYREKFTPIGAFVYALYKKLSYRDASINDLSNYFSEVHIPGGSGGLSPNEAIHWGMDTFSEGVWDKLINGSHDRTPEWRDVYF